MQMAVVNEVAAFDAPVDSAIKYPCYMSFDDIVDVERLKSLDDYITERIRKHQAAGRIDYFQNDHRLDEASAQEPGVREIWLSGNKADVPHDYLNLDRPELWEPTPAASDFAELMDFIATLPFKAVGRMLLIYDDAGNAVPAHRDHMSPELCHHFIWLRTNRSKPFYVLNHKTSEKMYVNSYSAWFDTVNQFHGSDSVSGLSFSIRIDGRFTDELTRSIPTPRFNRASQPALWACTTGATGAPRP